MICPVRVFRVFENAPFRKELANPLSGGDASREKCGSEMQCIGDGRRGCLGVGKSIFPGVVERMVTRIGLVDVYNIVNPPPPLTLLSRRGDTPGYGVTAGPVGNRQKVVVNILH